MAEAQPRVAAAWRSGSTRSGLEGNVVVVDSLSCRYSWCKFQEWPMASSGQGYPEGWLAAFARRLGRMEAMETVTRFDKFEETSEKE